MKRKTLIGGFAIVVLVLLVILAALIVKIKTKEQKLAAEKTNSVQQTDVSEGGIAMAAETKMPTDKPIETPASPGLPTETPAVVAETQIPPADPAAVLASLQVMQQPEMYTYDQMESDLQEIASAFPEQVMLHSLCTTYDQREMYELVIGDINASKHVMINASIHAREYITSQILMQQVCSFLQEHGTDAKSYLGDTAIHVIPMINPDGVTISQYGIEGLHTAEAKATVESIAEVEQPSDRVTYYRRWKSNAQGIDINRTFDAKWESYDDQVHHPSSDHYKGVQINDTVESQALVAVTKQYSFAKTISYHTQGNVIYWYFGQSGTLYDDTLALAQAAGSITGYGLDANYENLDPAGYKDWAISKMGIPSITVEIGTDYSPVDPAQYDTLWEQNKGMWSVLIG